MTSQNFADTGETAADGHHIHRAVGPVSGRFSAGYEWRQGANPNDARGWVLAINTTDDVGLEVNRVAYQVHVHVMIEPAKGCDKEPGREVSWHVRRMGGRWDDFATPAARDRLEALIAEVYSEFITTHGLWAAKVQRAQDQIVELQDARAKYLAENDQLIDAAARRLSFHLDNPA
ncbi:hypothetical protein [Nocardia acidivorans]|uniref:hypothetical protein n=1 Tax=Nocardia acidivorans TaxID=404580 RepID=UPI00083352B8|nr:hypothetical protein [Nocardia acidivorans]